MKRYIVREEKRREGGREGERNKERCESVTKNEVLRGGKCDTVG